MRVLWLSPVQTQAVAAATGRSVGRGGGWIDGLRRSIADYDQITLAIACVSASDFEPFLSEGVEYYPLYDPRSSSRFGRWCVRATFRDRVVDYGRQVDAVVAEFRPDVIHVHGTETSLGLCAERTDIPVLVSLQGIVSDIVAHYFDGLSAFEVIRDFLRFHRTVRGVGFLPGYLALRRAIPVEQRVLRAAHFFTGRTDYDHDAVERANPEGHYFHCDRVLRDEFYATPHRRSASSLNMLCVAGGAPYKGVELAIESMKLLEAYGLGNVRLRVVGALAGHSIESVLRARASRLGVAARIEWLGGMSAEELRAELESCAVFLMPSHVDNSPNALAEAMMTGAACIASDAGGIPSMVDDGVTGLLFERGNAASLADAARRLLTNEDLRVTLGDTARVVADDRHSRYAIREQTLNTYRSMEVGHS